MEAKTKSALEARTAERLGSFLLLIAAYISLNSSLNLMNKWSLGVYGFRFPFLLTSCHMAFSFLALAPVALRQPWRVHRRTLEKQWRGLACIGAFMALNIVLNNASLVGISLTLNQIIRSATPVVTCAVSVLVERKLPSRQEISSLLVLSAGVMLAVWQGALSGTPGAVLCAVASVACCGGMMCFTGRLLSEKLDVVRLTFYTAPVSLLCLLPATWLYEREAFLQYVPQHTDGALLIIAVTSMNAVCYNVVHSKMIKETSAVTTTVLGEVKIVGLLALSALVLGESKEFTLKMTVGCSLALLGFCMYSHTKIQKFRGVLQPSLVHVSLTANGSSPQSSETHGDAAANGDGKVPLLEAHHEHRPSIAVVTV